MRVSLGLISALTAAAIVGVACGDTGNGSAFDDGTRDDGLGGSGGGGGFGGDGTSGGGGSSGSSGGNTFEDIDQASMRIEPADAVFTIKPGQQVTQQYKVFGKVKGTGTEIDITSR